MLLLADDRIAGSCWPLKCNDLALLLGAHDRADIPVATDPVC